MKNDHRTIFTQAIAEQQTLDALTARLIHYHYHAMAHEKVTNDDLTPIGYVRQSITMFCVILVLEAASRLPEYYSEEFYRELSTLSPLPFDDLAATRLEREIWQIVREQCF